MLLLMWVVDYSHTIVERVRFSTICKNIALNNNSQKPMNAFIKMNRKSNAPIKHITVKQPSLYTKIINKNKIQTKN